ncbi:hypothetical protein PVAP13_2KG581600 [Panicum virgatum]|uniref:Methyltransferase type 11 domain-containing protein n=1 Tax=Panicum virgatum TaxID=38727 RepID=A0A8T0WCJ5_PANVG|nr:hypothetical protein PVAP13_2KG581600 [Panicum virgatum]
MSSPAPPDDCEGEGSGGRSLSYGEAEYWDARYVEEGGAPYDWYQRYDALRPFVLRFAPPASRLLMIGCGSAHLRMDVRDMSMFPDESFDCAIDKGTLDSLMCGVDAPLSAAQMVLEVDRLLKPGGVFILITYGDPSVRVPHLNQPGCKWKIVLYILPRPGFTGKIRRHVLDPVPLTERGRLPDGFVPEDPDSHYVYACEKMQGLTCSASPTVERQGEE